MESSASCLSADAACARALLTAYGCSGTAYMTLWPGNRVFFGPERACYIGYRLTGRAALALGDPIGPPDLVAPTIAAFCAYCRENGWTHAFYAATASALPAYGHQGYLTLKIGEEALIPLEGLTFSGKHWQDVRTARNRASRSGISCRLYQGGTLPGAVRDQLFAISAQWLQRKRIPELGFTLGTVTDIDDPALRVAVAMDEAGSVLAFTDWLPMFAADGWVLDLMRRRHDAPAGMMDFLIGSSLLAFRDQGDRLVSLGAAPLANLSHDPGRPLLERLMVSIARQVDAFYHFSSLYAFKAKFHPAWADIYLVYRRPIGLPRIAGAVLRSYLPGGNVRAIRTMIRARLAQRKGK